MGDSKYDRWQFHQVLMPSSVLYVIYWFYPVIHWAQHLSLVEYTVVQRCIVMCNFDSYGKILYILLRTISLFAQNVM